MRVEGGGLLPTHLHTQKHVIYTEALLLGTNYNGGWK